MARAGGPSTRWKFSVALIGLLTVIVLALGLLAPQSFSQASFDANNPAASGYRLVFSDDFADTSKFDLANTGAPGYKWYMDRFYWNLPSPASSVSIGSNGLILSDIIATAGLDAHNKSLVGRGWGGGAYFEALLSFNPDDVVIENRDWPAFYGLSWELAGGTDQAADQPLGYKHFAELDFMEYGFWNHRGQKANYQYFWQTIHDFYGVKNASCPGSEYCQILNNNTSAMKVPDIHGFHRYGSLWVPAKEKPGFVQAYFDGRPIGRAVYWPPRSGKITPPTSATAYSILDDNHLIIVLQSSTAAPMTVKSVKVWQIPGVGTCIGEC
jgi:hypothetical protein